LDFGLAKAMDSSVGRPGVQAADSARSSSARPTDDDVPTMTSPAMTQMGMILGTAAYMSPEQARGRVVDRRADIWAFGVVLYEMLTWRRLFSGDSVTDTIASVLRADIDLSALPASTPASVRRLVTRCLDRDPKTRLQHIGEARIALADPTDESIHHPTAEPSSRWRRGAPWPAVTVGLVLAAIAGALFGGPKPEPPKQIWMELAAPDAAGNGSEPAISWDGEVVAWASATGLRVRRVDGAAVRTLEGTKDGILAAWLPDGSAIVYRDPIAGAMKIVGLSDGEVRTLAATRTEFYSPIHVSARGEIAFDESGDGVKVVRATGGSVRTVVPVPDEGYVRAYGFIAGTGELLYSDSRARVVRAVSMNGSGDREIAALTELIFGGGRPGKRVPVSRSYPCRPHGSWPWRLDVGAATRCHVVRARRRTGRPGANKRLRVGIGGRPGDGVAQTSGGLPTKPVALG
jgi:serine/threonine-protein kinase